MWDLFGSRKKKMVSKVNIARKTDSSSQLRIRRIDVNPIPMIVKGIPSQAIGSLLYIFFCSNRSPIK